MITGMSARDVLLQIKASSADVHSQAINNSIDDALNAINLRDLMVSTLGAGRTLNFTGNKNSTFVGCSTIGDGPDFVHIVGAGGNDPLTALKDLLDRIPSASK